MQWLAEVCVKRPVFATMLVMSLVVVGAFSFMSLGVDLFPKIDLPIVTVTTTLRGAAPEEVEAQVSKRIEEAVNTISRTFEYSISGNRYQKVAEQKPHDHACR